MRKQDLFLLAISLAVVSMASYYSPPFRYVTSVLVLITLGYALARWVIMDVDDQRTVRSENWKTRKLNVECVNQERARTEGLWILITQFPHMIRSLGEGRVEMQKLMPKELEENIHPMLGEPRPKLMDAMSRCTCVLFVGARGRGKTTNMKRIMEDRVNQETAVVIDTHSTNSKWPYADEVVGSEVGLERRERLMGIWRKMESWVELMDERLDDMRKGLTPEGQFPDLCIYIDEFTHLPNAFKDEMNLNLKNITGRILTEGRKVNINFVWGSHTHRAESLGLKGTYALTECFDAIVHLHHSKKTGDFYATVDWSGDDKDTTQYELAEPYQDGSVVSSVDIDPGGVVYDLGEESYKVEDKPKMEIDEETGWPIIKDGTSREKLHRFGAYMQEMGFDIKELQAASVLDFLGLTRNGRIYRMWTEVLQEVDD